MAELNGEFGKGNTETQDAKGSKKNKKLKKKNKKLKKENKKLEKKAKGQKMMRKETESELRTLKIIHEKDLKDLQLELENKAMKWLLQQLLEHSNGKKLLELPDYVIDVEGGSK